MRTQKKVTPKNDLKKAWEEKVAAAKKAELKEAKRKKGLAHYLSKVNQLKKRT